jgi:hypothetical protein
VLISTNCRSHYWLRTEVDAFFAVLAATSTLCVTAGLTVLGDLTCRAGTWCSEGSGSNKPACSSSLKMRRNTQAKTVPGSVESPSILLPCSDTTKLILRGGPGLPAHFYRLTSPRHSEHGKRSGLRRSCLLRLVVLTPAARKAAVALEFRVNRVVNGLPVATATGLLPRYPLELHCCTSIPSTTLESSTYREYLAFLRPRQFRVFR